MESVRLIDELSKMPPMVISTAYLYAIHYTLYGEDVTKTWQTATQNASALEKAYRKGYYDALQTQTETCKGCRHIDQWENEIEFGCSSPCTRCKRRSFDNYEKQIL